MASSVSTVDLSNGIVTDHAPEDLTVDVPAGLDAAASEVYLDKLGILHFQAADGLIARLGVRTRPVSERLAEEECFIVGDRRARNAYGWQIYRRCVLE